MTTGGKTLLRCPRCWESELIPHRGWVGLTDEEIYEIHENSSNLMEFTKIVEAKLKEKNT